MMKKLIQMGVIEWVYLFVFVFGAGSATVMAADKADLASDVAAAPTPSGQYAKGAAGPEVQLAPVIVTAPRVISEIARVPAAVSAMQGEEIHRGRPAVKLNDALVRVPGVFVQNEQNYAQDLRVSIRGFGARSAFGIRGIQIQVDGLPYTLPDGQSAFDSIDPNIIQQLEVMRGPASALYGNAAGGVISITTEDGSLSPSLDARAVIGEFGFSESLLKGGGQYERINTFAALSHVKIDGFRDHSQAESSRFYGKLRYDLDDVADITLIMNGMHTPEAYDPGGLTLAQAEANPEQAGSLNLNYDTREVLDDGRIALMYRREVVAGQHLEVAAFGGRRDLENAIPFTYIDLEREILGGRIQYDLSGTLLALDHRLVFGLDLQHQADDRLNYTNVGGEAGNELLLDQDESVTALGLYLQEEVEPMPGLSVLLGGRYDNVQFEIDDHFAMDGDDSGSRTFDQFTGRWGVTYALRPHVRTYAAIAQSFETPTTTEVVNRPEGGGGINPDIEPQTAINYEIGMKSRFSPRSNLEVALFFIQLDDELIAFRDVTDRVFYRNAGESQRIGAEIGFDHRFARSWQWHLAYTYLDAEFDTFVKEDTDLGGNQVPGLPEHRVFSELRYTHVSGLYAAGSVLYVGEFFVDDENSLKNDAYTVLDARLGFEKKFEKWRIEPFGGVRNIFDEAYNSNVRINANGGRYFEPAPERNWYGGLRISYQ
jgi:iron complex outermembrane receptor protein